MLESDLFGLLEQTADAAYVVTESGEVVFWSGAATRLFGYTREDAIGRNIDEIFEARDDLDTPALAGGLEAATRRWDATAGGIPDFDLEVRHQSGARIWLNVSTILFENGRTGRRLFVRLARGIAARRHRDDVMERMLAVARQLVTLDEDTGFARVEALSEQERRILQLLADGRSSTAITQKLRISAQTLRNHLHHINRKLRTHNRLEAVTHARRRGLID